MKKTILNGPGSSTGIAGVGAMLVECDKALDFDVATGVSASSMALVPIVMGEHEMVLHESVHINHKEIFDPIPLGPDGSPHARALWRAAWGMMRTPFIKEESDRFCSFGLQDVKPLMRRLCPKSMFDDYQKGDYPRIYIVACNYTTRKPVPFNINNRDVDYELFLKIVSASCRIPIMTQPEKIGKYWYYDGGMTDTNAGIFVMNNELQGEQIDRVVSVYPRTENIEDQPAPPPLKNIANALDWAISVWIHTVIRDDAQIERLECHKRGISDNLLQMFCNRQVHNLYDVNPDNLKALREDSIKIAKKKLKEFL